MTSQVAKAKGEKDKPTPRPGALSKLRHWREELARVYRDGRTGVITTKDMSRLAYVLRLGADMTQEEDFEARIEVLEAQAPKHRRRGI